MKHSHQFSLCFRNDFILQERPAWLSHRNQRWKISPSGRKEIEIRSPADLNEGSDDGFSSNCLQRVGCNRCAANLSDSLVVFFVKWHAFTLSMTSGEFDRFFMIFETIVGKTHQWTPSINLRQCGYLKALQFSSTACSTRNRMIVSELLFFFCRSKTWSFYF